MRLYSTISAGLALAKRHTRGSVDLPVSRASSSSGETEAWSVGCMGGSLEVVQEGEDTSTWWGSRETKNPNPQEMKLQ